MRRVQPSKLHILLRIFEFMLSIEMESLSWVAGCTPESWLVLAAYRDSTAVPRSFGATNLHLQ